MGRGKIEIKRIENTSNRQVTYSKRRNGIIKKAKEITVLCDAKVSLVIISSSGKINDYCSPSTNLIEMLGMYQKHSGKRLWDAKHEDLNNEIERVRKENDSLQTELRHLKGEDLNSLHHKQLIAMENNLENGLEIIRNKKMEYFYKMKNNNEQFLDEENKRLMYILEEQGGSLMGGNGGEIDENGGGGGVSVPINHYQSQLPFAFLSMDINH